MAKAWSEVESSPSYQGLSTSAKMSAKRQYFREVVAAKPEYQAYSGPDRQEAFRQFMGIAKPKVDTLADVGASMLSGAVKSLPVQAGFAITNPIRKALGQEEIDAQDFEYEPQTTAGKVAGPVAEIGSDLLVPGGTAVKGLKGGFSVAKTALQAGVAGAASGGARSALQDVNQGETPSATKALKGAAIEGGLSMAGGAVVAKGANAVKSYLAKAAQSPSVKAVSERISVGDKKSLLQKISEEGSAAYRKYVNELDPIESAEKALGGTGEIAERAQVTRGIGGKVQQTLENGLTPILADVKKLGPTGLDEFRTYSAARRARELMNRGIETGFQKNDVNQTIRALHPKYREQFKRLQNFQDSNLRYARDEGTISQDMYDAIKRENLAYVPFQRVLEIEQQASGGGNRFANLQSGIKALKGSELEIVDPFESIVKNTHDIIAYADKNAVGKALVNLAGSNPGTNLVKKSYANAPNAARVIIDGKHQWYEFDPELGVALENLDRRQLPDWIKLFQFPASTLRAGAVLSPEFMASNPARDTIAAGLQSKYGFVPVWDTLKGAAHVLGRTDLYKTWRLAGGDNALMTTIDRGTVQEQLANVLADPEKKIAMNIVNPLEGLRTLSDFFEKTTRLGEFSRATKKLGTSPEALRKAAVASREVTLDFSRMGSQMRSLNAIVAFLNANVQGWDKMARTLTDPKTAPAAWAKVGAGITLPSMALTAHNMRDERWKEIPDWEKVVFWHVMTPDRVLRIPKPQGYALLFATPAERLTEFIGNKDPKALTKIGASLLQGVPNPLGVSAAVPVAEALSNYSFFQGKPIVPTGRQDVDPEYRYTDRTTESAKAIGEALAPVMPEPVENLAAPAVIENTVRGYTGNLGMRALELADKVTKRGREAEKRKPASGIETATGARAFVSSYERGSNQQITNFYKAHKKAKTKHNTFEMLVREDPTQAREYLIKNIDQIAKYEATKEIADALAQLSAAQNAIEIDDRKDASTKRMAMNRIRKMAAEIVKKTEGAYSKEARR